MQKFGRLGLLLFLIHLCLFQLPAIGQNKKVFVVTGKIVPEVETSESGIIEMSKSGAAPTSITIPKNGRFRLELEYFNEFTLIFKLPGHFSKTIIVSTDIPQEVWKRDSDFPPFPMIVQLFKEIEGIDKSFTLKPSGRVFYGKQTDNFEKESIFNDIQIAEQITTATSQSAQVKKEAGTITKQESLDLAVKQKTYDQSINEADVLFKRGEFPAALLKYQEAKKLFPEKVYANDRIAEIQDLVKALEITQKQKTELDQKYKNAIELANGSFDQKAYTEARPRYEEAMQYKPADVYASGRIQEIDRLLALQEKQKQFDDLITQADNSYKAKKFDQAVALYTQAKQIIPENEYSQNQINLVTQEKQQVTKSEEQEKVFTQTMDNADNLVRKKDYIQAINSYRKALELKPDNKLAADKIAETEQAIAIIETDKKYQETIQQADQALAGNDLQKAKMYYQDALKLKSSEAYPANKLAEIKVTADNKKKEEDRALALAAKEKAYTDAIAKADKSFTSENYADARKTYTEALTIKPNEAYPTGRITKIDEILAQKAKQQQTENEFMVLVGKGDAALGQKDYEAAKGSYSSALGIKSNAEDVKTKIKNIDSILQKLAEDKKKEEESALASAAKEKAYTDALAKADKSFTAENYTDAKKAYTKALTIKPNEAYPTGRITKIDEILAEKAKQQQTETAFLALVGKGDASFGQKDYETAKGSYSSALGIKPNVEEVTAKIKNIDSILQKIADNKKKEEDRALALAGKEKAYTDAIAKADKSFTAENYTDAKTSYTEALTIKPNEAYPTGRITKIDEILAEKGKQQQTEVDFLAMVTKGDAALGEKDYETAKGSYSSALGIKPNVEEVTAKIKNIDSILQKIAEDKKKEEDRLLALTAANEKAYTETIAKGNKQIDQKTYSDAKVTFQEAKKLKPTEQLPDEMIAKIDTLMAGNERELAAARLKEEAYQKSIKEAQGNSFMEAMAKADKAFTENDFNTAKTGYQTALTIIATDPTAKEKLGQTEAKLAELAKLTQAYNTAINAANKYVGDKQYKEAKEKYQEALQYLPDSDYPKDQIAKIDVLLKELANSEQTAKLSAMGEAQRLAKEKATKGQYDKAIATADEAFAAKQYVVSRTNYSTALNILPSEKYPKDQISKIDDLLASHEDKLPVAVIPKEVISTASTIKAPVYNPVETEKATEKRAQSFQGVSNYDEAIKKADDSFGIKDYTVARFYYYKASDLKLKEEYPKNQIELIRKLVDAELSAIDRSGYQQAITQADDAFKIKSYTVAKFFYNKALGIKSWEKYPKDQIEEILALTNSLLSEREEKAYRDLIAEGDEAYTVKDISVARFYYNKAITIKKDDDYPRIKIKDIQKIIDQDTQDVQKLEYNKLIEQADQAMESESFSIARFNYNKALTLKPEEKYPKDQLKLIKEKLVKPKK